MFDIPYDTYLPGISGIFPFPFGVSLLVFLLIGWVLVRFPIANAGAADEPVPPSAVM
jgi:hypothetical protein